MQCMICNSKMTYHFTKHFEEFGLRDVDYWICSHCGFCSSKTHLDMSEVEWQKLNMEFHAFNNQREDNPYNRSQRYFYQSVMLHVLKKNKIVDPSPWLDWGCGVGNVSRLLQEQFSISIQSYDQYIQPEHNAVREEQLQVRGYDLVLNTGVFEHVRSRKTIDKIESYVADTGSFAIHTLVRGSIPKDPDWMYLLPVHCSFHTNKSMQILMDAWGYSCSVYNEQSKIWVLFRKSPGIIEESVSNLNRALGWEYLIYKKGFTDHWP